MNKILHINISGQIIAIQAPAYEVLQAYLASLRQHFAAEEGCEEIINDIEGRIAEMLSEKIRGGLPAIDIEAVTAVANTMGHPADFARDAGEASEQYRGVHDRQAAGHAAAGGAGAAASGESYGTETSPPPKRLYRDSKDRWLGGVCSGIANYLNIDTTLVRFLFAVVSFGGFGLGFLIYLALWILLPEKELEGATSSRLFRNPDDKILGGVCSGIAAYLGKEPKLVRWVFSAPLIINAFIAFGAWMLYLFSDSSAPALISSSLVSTMVFAYVVLWIVLPEAATPYDHMRMRREPVDINAIKQRVQAGLAVAKQRLAVVGDEMRSRSQQWQAQGGWGAGGGAAGAASHGDVEDAQYVAGAGASSGGAGARRHPVSTGIGHAIRVLFQVFFLFIAGVMAFSLFVTLFALAIGSAAWWPLRDYLWTSAWQETLAWTTAGLFFLLPAVAFVIWLFRRVVGAKRNAALGWAFGILWTLGWVSATLFAVNVSADLRTYEHVEQQLTAPPLAPADVLHLTVSEPQPTQEIWWLNGPQNGVDIDERSMRLSVVRVSFHKSAGDAYGVAVRKFAAGTSEAEAKARAERTKYQVTWQGATLDLGSHLEITPAEKFRGQNIEVVVGVPVGRQVRVDASVGEKLAFGNEEHWHADWPGRWHGDAHGDAHGEWHGKGLPDDEDPHEFRYDFQLVPDTNYVMGSDGKLRPLPLTAPSPQPSVVAPSTVPVPAPVPASPAPLATPRN